MGPELAAFGQDLLDPGLLGGVVGQRSEQLTQLRLPARQCRVLDDGEPRPSQHGELDQAPARVGPLGDRGSERAAGLLRAT